MSLVASIDFGRLAPADLDFDLATAAPGAGGAPTVLRREANGTVTVLSLATPYTPILTRQPNGSVNVGA